MAKAFADLAAADQAKDLAHADWLALLLDMEASWRRDKRLTARLRAAKLRQQASIEDVDYRASQATAHRAICDPRLGYERAQTLGAIQPIDRLRSTRTRRLHGGRQA